MQVCLALYLLLILMMTPASSYAWDHLPLLGLAQFPWRILSVTAVLQVVCASGLAPLWERGPARRAWLLPLLLGGAFFWQQGMRGVQDECYEPDKVAAYREAALFHRHLNAMTDDNLRPRTAGSTVPETVRGTRPLVEAARGAAAQPLPGDSSFHLRYSVRVNDVPVEATINQLYFPGWRVEVNGRRLADEELLGLLLPDGRMRVRFPEPGVHTLEAWYDGPPGWRYHAALVALACAGFVWFCFREWKAQAAKPSEPARS